MTTPREINAVLSAVIDLAVEIVNNRTGIAAGRLGPITTLAVQVDAIRALHFEGGNPVGAEVSELLEVLSHVELEREIGRTAKASQWCAIAGLLLEMVKETAVEALALGLRRPSTTDHDYGDRKK